MSLRSWRCGWLWSLLLLAPACSSSPDGTPTVSPSAVDQAPVALITGPTSAGLGVSVSLDGGSSADPEGAALTFAWSVAAPAGSAFVPGDTTTSRLGFVPDVAGAWEVVLVVNDGVNTSAPARHVVEVAANQPPSAEAGPDRTVEVGVPVLLDGLGSSDPEGAALSYRWALVLVPPGSRATLTGSDTALASFTPDLVGEYALSLTVGDGAAEDVDVATLRATADGNHPPEASAGVDRDVDVGDVVTLEAGGSSDPDQDPLSFTWALLSAPAGSAVALSALAGITTTLTPDVEGDYVVELTAFDGSTRDTDTVIVEAEVGRDTTPHPSTPTEEEPSTPAVNESTPPPPRTPTPVGTPSSNGAPHALFSAPEGVHVGECAYLRGEGSTDPDGDPLTYAWELVGAPDGSHPFFQVMEPPSRVAFSPDDVGPYQIRLTVSDGQASDSATLTVDGYFESPMTPEECTLVNHPPTVEITPRETEDPSPDRLIGEPIKIEGEVQDPEGDELLLQWTFDEKPEGSQATFKYPTRPSTEFTPDLEGTYGVRLTASDGAAATSQVLVFGVVHNRAPQAALELPSIMYVGEEATFDGGRSYDPDGDELTYTWRVMNAPEGSTAQISSYGYFAGFVPDLEGSYWIELKVDDGEYDSGVYDIVSAMVREAGRAPAAAPAGGPRGAASLGPSTSLGPWCRAPSP